MLVYVLIVLAVWIALSCLCGWVLGKFVAVGKGGNNR
jgi:hypothetical protein